MRLHEQSPGNMCCMQFLILFIDSRRVLIRVMAMDVLCIENIKAFRTEHYYLEAIYSFALKVVSPQDRSLFFASHSAEELQRLLLSLLCISQKKSSLKTWYRALLRQGWNWMSSTPLVVDSGSVQALA